MRTTDARGHHFVGDPDPHCSLAAHAQVMDVTVYIMHKIFKCLMDKN